MDRQTQQNLLKIVKRNYEKIAEHYNETRKKHLLPLWGELVKIAKGAKDDDKILDVGCGNGRLLKAFEGKKINYIGVDNSEKLIGLAKSEIRNQKSEFRKGDILELSKIPEINFDYVFCVAVLHHIPGKDLQIQALKQLKNKIKPDGKIVITVWNLWGQKKFRKLIWKTELEKLIYRMSRRFCKTKSRYLQRSPKLVGVFGPEFALRTSGDFGDILFDWKNSKGERVSQRYYHAFTKRQLKKITKKAGLKIEKNYKDKFNYYAILTK